MTTTRQKRHSYAVKCILCSVATQPTCVKLGTTLTDHSILEKITHTQKTDLRLTEFHRKYVSPPKTCLRWAC